MSNWKLPAGVARSENIGISLSTTTRTTVTTGTNNALGSWTSLGTSTIRAQTVQLLVSPTLNARSVGWQLGINSAGPYAIAEGVITAHRSADGVREIRLPLQIPENTQIYLKTSHTADTTAHNCVGAVRLWEHNHYGGVPSAFCETLGANLGASTAEKQTSIAGTSANNEGSWTSLGTIANDWRGFLLHVTRAASTNHVNINYLTDVGIDRAGGTSFTSLVDDLFSCVDSGGDDHYLSPAWVDRDVPAGAALGIRFRSSASGETLYGHLIGAVK